MYAAAFGVLGAVAAALTRLAPRLPWDSALVLILVWLAAYLLGTLQGSLVSDVAAATLGLGIGVVAARGYRARRGRILAFTRHGLPWLFGLGLVAFALVRMRFRPQAPIP